MTTTTISLADIEITINEEFHYTARHKTLEGIGVGYTPTAALKYLLDRIHKSNKHNEVPPEIQDDDSGKT